MSQTDTVTSVGYERPNQGGSPASDHVQFAYELLGDGKWKPYYKVLVAVAARVHPSKAYRYVMRSRVTDPFDTEERAAMVRTGQRALARMALDRKERFEQRVTAKGVRQVRMIPFKVRSPEDYARSSRKGWVTKPRSERPNHSGGNKRRLD